jgi:hypothetical protein
LLPEEPTIDLESFIITVFCTIDDFLRQSCPKLRQRDPAPTLADSEVLAIEAVGEFLRIDTDRELDAYFRRHFGDLFPGLLTIHRTTFARQAANLWVIKSRLWQHLTAMGSSGPSPGAHRQPAGAGLPLRPGASLPRVPRHCQLRS